MSSSRTSRADSRNDEVAYAGDDGVVLRRDIVGLSDDVALPRCARVARSYGRVALSYDFALSGRCVIPVRDDSVRTCRHGEAFAAVSLRIHLAGRGHVPVD